MTITDHRTTQDRIDRLERLCDQIGARLDEWNSQPGPSANELDELPPGMFPPTSEFSR